MLRFAEFHDDKGGRALRKGAFLSKDAYLGITSKLGSLKGGTLDYAPQFLLICKRGK